MVGKKKVKKFLVFGILSLFIISMMAGVLGHTSSTTTHNHPHNAAVQAGIEFIDFFKGIFVGTSSSGGTDTLSIVFFSILLAMVVYTSVKEFFDSKFIRWVATGSITALGIITIPTNFIEVIQTQYGVMGAALLTVIPFAIVVFFTIKTKNKLIGSVTWIFFTMYYFAIFISKIMEQTEVIDWSYGLISFWELIVSKNVFPYLLAVIAGIIMIFFLAYFRKWFFEGALDAQVEAAKHKRAIRRAHADLEAEAAEAELNRAASS